jgi:hypothetical protein
MGSSWPRLARGAGNTLNAYVIGHTQCMAGIKFIQDIDIAGRGQYDADLLDILNGQATVRGDLTPQRSKATIVTDDPSTRTISHMGAMW